jgi:hypothetical protein
MSALLLKPQNINVFSLSMAIRCWTRTPIVDSPSVLQACQSAFSSAQFDSKPPLHFVSLAECPQRNRHPHSINSPSLQESPQNFKHTRIFLPATPGHHSASPSRWVKYWPQHTGHFDGSVPPGCITLNNNNNTLWRIKYVLQILYALSLPGIISELSKSSHS